MTERYDSTAARHYAAFRPPLHSLILDRVIRRGETFPVGLDVGCGTGYSAIALARYCERVVGLDRSRSMLDAAQPHAKVSYFEGSGDSLSHLPVQRFDVVTFAGALFYAKSNALRKELSRVCPPGGVVLVYDFEVILDHVMQELETSCPAMASDYDHQANLSEWFEFATEISGADSVQLDVTPEAMGHVLLSDSNRYDALSRRFPDGDTFAVVVEHLGTFAGSLKLEANVFFTRYRVESG